MRLAAAVSPERGKERFFALWEIEAAVEWADAGGIALHRNFDLDGLVIGGRVRSGPAYHVLGQQDVLLEWGQRHRLNAAWLQPAKVDFPPHFDVFGALARRLEAREEARDV